MTDSVILNTPVILIITVIAVIIYLAGRFVSGKRISAGCYIASFLCVIGCVTYALLLGVELDELLSYVLLFTLLGLTAFIPTAQSGAPSNAVRPNDEPTETSDSEGDNEL